MGEHDTWFEGDDPTAEVPLERYAVQGELGRGAMGVVEEVMDRRLERVVARKTVRSGANVSGFRREAQIAAALEHPGIVPIYEASEGPDGPWYTMRRIEGRSLEEALEPCGTLEERLAFVVPFLRLCEAMAYAHRRGVVHRDLKPANVMLGAYGEVVVVDFGLATSIDASNAGRIVGTPAYMSPEAAKGHAPSPAADVWSLGAVLYEILAGRPPWLGGALEILERIRVEDPPPVTDGIDRAPPELVAIVTKAMSRDQAQRYPDAGALRADVEAFTTGRLVGAYSYTSGELFRRFVREYRGYLSLVAGALAVVAVIGSIAVYGIEQGRLRALAAESQRTQQLALALQARARALGSDPRSREVAERALALDPTLPWARGILAEVSHGTRVEKELALARTGCTWGDRLDGHLLLHCDQELLLLDPETGRVRDRTPWPHWSPTLVPGGLVITKTKGRTPIARVQHGSLQAASVPIHPMDRNTDNAMLTWDSRGNQLILADQDGTITLFERTPEGFEPTRTLDVGSASAVASSGRRHLLYHTDNTVLCDLDYRDCERIPFAGAFQHVSWLSDERAVLLATSGELYLLDSDPIELRLIERLPPGLGIDVVALDPQTVAVLVADGSVRLYDDAGSQTVAAQSSGLHPRSLLSHQGELWVIGTAGVERWQVVRAEAFSVRRLPDGIGSLTQHRGQIVTSYRNRVVALDDATSSTRELLVADSFVKDLISDGGALRVAQSRGPTVLVQGDRSTQSLPSGVVRIGVTDGHWVAATFKQSIWLDGEETRVRTRGDLGTGGGRICVQTEPHVVEVRELPDLELVWRQSYDQDIWALALSPDGDRAAIALDDHSVRQVELATGTSEPLEGSHTGPIADLTYSPSGRRLASGSWDGTSRIWRDGKLEAALEAHRGRVTQLLFVDEDQLYTGSWDQTVRRWDLTAWE